MILIKKIIAVSFFIIATSSCSKRNDNELQDKNVILFKSIYSEFEPLWKLYKDDSSGGWLNNDQGRFSNDDAAVLEGLVYLYETTSDNNYLKHFFEISDRLNSNDDVARRISDKYRNNKVLPGWSSIRYTSDNSHHIFNLDDALILYPYVKMYRLFSQKGEQGVPLIYVTKINALLKRAEDSFEKIFLEDWKQVDINSGFFQDPYFTNQRVHMPLNQLSIVGQLCLDLYLATKNDVYKNYALCTATYLKNNMEIVGDFIQWDYNIPYSSTDDKEYGVDDIGHGSWITFFAVNCFIEGVVFTRADLELLINTFVNKISKPNNEFAMLIDGTGVNEEPLVTQFYILAPYSIKAKKILDDYYKNRIINIKPNSILNHIGYHYILYYAMKVKYN